jgi:hypothetical protein
MGCGGLRSCCLPVGGSLDEYGLNPAGNSLKVAGNCLKPAENGWFLLFFGTASSLFCMVMRLTRLLSWALFLSAGKNSCLGR